jgi:hypothetical protein
LIESTHILPTVITDLEVAEERWDALNSCNVAPSPFTEFSFIQALAASFGWEIRTVLWGDVLGACFIVRKRGFSEDVVVPPFSPYSCVTLSNTVPISERRRILQYLFDDIPQIPFSRVISLDPQLPPVTGIPSSFNSSAKQTYSIRTSTFSNALSSFSESARRHVNRSTGDYSFRTTPIPLALLCQLVEGGYEHHHRSPPLNGGDFLELATRLSKTDYAQMVGVFEAESNAFSAGIVLLVSKTTAWYWLAGSVRGPSMTILLAQTIDYLHQQNINTFDLMGANTDGVSEFKRRFGGELTAYTHWTRKDWGHRLMSFLGKARRSLRNIS